MRDQEDWTQSVFAQKLGIKHQNNVSARLENPNYGKHSLSTLKKIAAACDVALVVWFIPFSRLLDWVTGTPFTDNGLSEGFYHIPSFANDPALGLEPQEQLGNMPKENEKCELSADEVQKPTSKRNTALSQANVNSWTVTPPPSGQLLEAR